MDNDYRVVSWHFHWRFWRPKDCLGGPVYFGQWAVCEGHDGTHRTEQSAAQVAVKRDMGLIAPWDYGGF